MGQNAKLANVPIVGFLCLLIFLSVASLVSRNNVARFDNAVTSWIQGNETASLTVMMKMFTFIGSTPVVILLSLCTLFMLYRVFHHRWELLLFIWIVAGAALCNYLLKSAYHRQRPNLHRLIQETGYSFPSGHSMEAFALYGALAFLLWKHIPARGGRVLTIGLCTTMILMIGVSRIYLGVHYPSDVAGGYLASGCWLALSVWCFQWFMEYRYRQKQHRHKLRL